MVVGISAVGEDWIWADWPRRVGAAVTTTRQGGHSEGVYAGLNLADHVGDARSAVARNRQALRREIGVERIQWLDQIHGTRCVYADGASAQTVPQADAAWTAEPNLALAVLTADCLPVVFAHRAGAAVAVAHAGWRGLVAGVLSSVLDALPGEPADYLVWIGPGIGVNAYEVGADVADAVRHMQNVGLGASSCLHPDRPGKYRLDLAGLATLQLRHLGAGVVSAAPVCAFTDARFYSYRRDGVTGRMATLVWRSA